MAKKTTDSAAAESKPVVKTTGLGGRASRLLHWAGDSKFRMALVGMLFITLFGGFFAAWSYLAHLAVDEREVYTLEKALQALNQGEYDKAKNIIGEIQHQGNDSEGLGGSLFVLGAVKAAQADLEWSKARQRAMHLVAARYLQKARELGVPAELESRAQFLVGKSLIRGNQPQAGIDVLQTALDATDLPVTQVHSLLAEAYQSTPEPSLQAALEHNQAVLDDNELSQDLRNATSISQANILGKLGRLDEAKKYLSYSGTSETQQARIKSISGQLAISRAERLPRGSSQRNALADQARTQLREAQLLDPLNSELTRQAMYWIGKSYEITGDYEEAIERYDQLGKSYGDTAESLTALLAKADLARAAGDSDKALAGYRTVLGNVSDPTTYVNPLLSLSAMQKRLSRAYHDFVDQQQFDEAMALVDSLQPMFSLEEATELRAQAHEKWARAKQTEAEDVAHWDAGKILAEGRYHHRAAGAAYKLLSELRFASRKFTDDLWNAAENFYQGQSYSHAERMLNEYLHHEAQLRQAIALLRLGQAQLAQGDSATAIDTLEECIELYPGDAVIYQARLDCAHAHLQQAQGDRAEELLRLNLVGGNLEPEASEWRDSLFLLGDYLHNSDRYNEAIKYLDEAVNRYPEASQALLARYTIARSFHNAADKPAQLAREAKTESERQKNRKLRDDNLEAALENYLQVQRILTLQGHVDSDELERLLLRNCYMMQGSVLFELKRYEEARKAYANISTLYQNEPFVLESFVHVANCYRRLNKPIKAKGTIEQAKLVLKRLPLGTDFKVATNFSRQSWDLLLNEMSEW